MNHEASMQDMCKDMNSVSCNFVFTFPKLRGSEASKYVEESIKYILTWLIAAGGVAAAHRACKPQRAHVHANLVAPFNSPIYLIFFISGF